LKEGRGGDEESCNSFGDETGEYQDVDCGGADRKDDGKYYGGGIIGEYGSEAREFVEWYGRDDVVDEFESRLDIGMSR